MRDWARAQTLGYYTIRPSQFNTRKPLHLNDDDLAPTTSQINAQDQITERPRSEFTNSSYTVYAIELAVFARESVDLRGPLPQSQRQEDMQESTSMRNHLNKKYEDFVTGLPSYFRLGSTMGLTSIGPPMAAMPVHRWMLHQQLWSLFLRLHRGSLASQNGRAYCQLLAQNIISSQAQIQARCAVCSYLSTSDTQLFNAAIVLLIDLLFSTKRKEIDRSNAELNRLMLRDKIREAIELLRTRIGAEGSQFSQGPQWERARATALRSVMALESLMKLEEENFDESEESNGQKTNTSASKSLKDTIIDTLKALHAANDKKADTVMNSTMVESTSVTDMSLPLSTAIDGVSPDFDILLVLSNDISDDFWQFFNFVPPQSLVEDGSLPTDVDLQALLDSMPSDSSLGVSPSRSSFATPEFP